MIQRRFRPGLDESNSSNNYLVLTKKTLYFFQVLFNSIIKWIYGFLLKQNQLILYVESSSLLQVLAYMKYNTLVSINSLLDIIAVDLLNSKPYRFELNYVFWCSVYEYRIIIKTYTNGLFSIPSLSRLYSSSQWLEREVWDMFGIKFIFHPNLRRILTDYGFKGFPLRKDFPLMGYFEMFYNDTAQIISITAVEMTQNLRFYRFNNSWNNWCK